MRSGFLVGVLGFLAQALGVAYATDLRIYTTWTTAQTGAFEKAYMADNPDVKIVWLRDTASAIQGRLQAERAAPGADVVLGVPASVLLAADIYPLLAPLADLSGDTPWPEESDALNPPRWIAVNGWSATVCFNPLQATRQGVQKPASWQDLLAPANKGRLVMPDPVRSPTGYFYVSGWIALWGENAAWAYMDRLHENVAYYTANGSRPCRLAAAGEMLLGLSFDFRASRLKALGAPIELVFPQEGLGWETEIAAVLAGSSQAVAGKRLLDWATTRAARSLMASQYAFPVNAGASIASPHLPADLRTRRIKFDVAWAAENRQRIVAEWQRRYGGKVEPVLSETAAGSRDKSP